MTIRALLPLLLTMGLSGRAAAQTSPRPTTDWGQVQFYRDRGLTRGVIAGGADSVWKVLGPAFKDLGLKLTVQDQASGQLGNPRFRAVHQIGKTPVSRYFSCGDGLTGPNADSWHVFIGFGMAVIPAGPTKTRFELQMQAEAIDIPDGRNERVPCTTTGLLEYALVNHLNEVFPGTK